MSAAISSFLFFFTFDLAVDKGTLYLLLCLRVALSVLTSVPVYTLNRSLANGLPVNAHISSLLINDSFLESLILVCDVD